MSEIIQNISDIFSIISLVFSICCGKFFTSQEKNIFFLGDMTGYEVFFFCFSKGPLFLDGIQRFDKVRDIPYFVEKLFLRRYDVLSFHFLYFYL